MRILITGATGVLGRPVTRQLVEIGHQVRGLARSKRNAKLLTELGAESVRGDLFDPASLVEATTGCEAILHLATKIPPTAQIGKRSAWTENDRIRREGTRHLVDAALAHQISTVLYPSICFVYPESGAAWIDATTCPQPIVAEYYRTTFDAEREVARCTTATDGRGIVLRMGFFYGPESAQSVEQLRYAARGIATALGRPDAYHPIIGIADAARAVVAALEHAPAGIFDIAEDDPPTTAQLSQAMAKAVGRRRLYALPAMLTHTLFSAELVDAMSRSQRVTNRRFKEATGWQPQITTQRAGWEEVAQAMQAEQPKQDGAG